MKIQLTILFILLTTVTAFSQFTCGGIHKPINTVDISESTVAMDRFNNAYSKEDLDEFEEKSKLSIQTGYFNLFIDDELKNVPTLNHPNQGDLSLVIEKVFSDVSALINQRSHTLACGDQLVQHPVNLIISTDVCSGDDDCENATSPAAGSGSAFYDHFYLLNGIGESCNFISESNVWLKINAQKEDLPSIFDGIVHINIENPSINYGIDYNNPPVADKVDLYSVVLHEVLHVLGFSSRITEDGSARTVEGFNLSFYTRYDQMLHLTDNYQVNGQSENVQNLTTNAPGVNCYSLTDSVTDFTGLLANNCNVGEKSIVFGQDAIAPISGGIAADVANALSHLSESCHGSSENFVMDPSIQNGDNERTISDSEKKILCALGYDVKGIECDACFVHPGFINYSASSNDLVAPYYNSCCDAKFYTEVNVPITFDKDDVFCNTLVVNDEDIEITDIFLTTSVGELTALGNENYEFSSTQPGLYIVIFTVTNCNGYSSTSVLQINVHERKDDCPIDIPCDNLVCNFDFEDYEITNYINYQTGFDNLFLFENTLQNSVDICSSNSNQVSTLTHIWEPEGQLIPLLQPLVPGCKISISADLANREGSTGLLSISGSEFKPCVPTEALVTRACNTFGSNSISNTCEDSAYIPYCLVSSEAITNDHPGLICPNENLELETYTWEIEHTGDTDINFLVIHNEASNSVIWVDNLIVTQDCPPTFTIEAQDVMAVVNETQILEIEVCFEDAGNFQFNGAEIEILVLDQPDITILDEGDFIAGATTVSSLQENSCVSVFLHFIPTVEGALELNLISEVSSKCKEEEITVDVTVSEVLGISLNQLSQIPEGSTIYYYNQLGIELCSYPISHKSEVQRLYKPLITSIYPFTIVRNGQVIVADKVYLIGN